MLGGPAARDPRTHRLPVEGAAPTPGVRRRCAANCWHPAPAARAELRDHRSGYDHGLHALLDGPATPSGVASLGRPQPLVGFRGEWSIPRDIEGPDARRHARSRRRRRRWTRRIPCDDRVPATRSAPAAGPRSGAQRWGSRSTRSWASRTWRRRAGARTPRRWGGCATRWAPTDRSRGWAPASLSAQQGRRGVRWRRRRGTATSRRCARSRATAVGAAGWTRRWPTGWSVAASRSIARRRSRMPSWSGCGAATTSRCVRRRCGGCCMRPRPGRRRRCRSNVEDIDLDNKRARVRSKGGDTEWLHLQAGSARLLPRLIGGRPRGPLFLADRRPAPARTPAGADLCPVTGRARLSYRRAEELFSVASGGWTLHQLRHSALTHLTEAPCRGARQRR